MPGSKKVKELMLPLSEYPVVYETDTLKEAVLVLKRHLAGGRGYRSILVFSKTRKVGSEDQLVGILTVRDILNAMKRNNACYDGTELFKESWAMFYHRDPLQQCQITRVGDVVRPLVEAYIQADQDVTQAIRKMMAKNVNILPVFEGNRAVGLIRAVDLLDYIGEML